MVPVSRMDTKQNLENEPHDMDSTELGVVRQIYSNVDDRVYSVAPEIIANDSPNESAKEATENPPETSGKLLGYIFKIRNIRRLIHQTIQC